MWFRNLQIYRLTDEWPTSTEKLDAALVKSPLNPCGNQETQSRGWVFPLHEGLFVHSVNRQQLIALGIENKLLPASVVKQIAQERADEIAERDGHPVGRKQMRDLREQVYEELLPRAFVRRRTVWAWADPVNRWLAIDAASPAKSDELVEALNGSLGKPVIAKLNTQSSAGAAMTSWLAAGDSPVGFTLDQDLELRSPLEDKATVRYVRHALDGREIIDHIAAGKAATRLGMTWRDKISFVLTERCEVKRLAFLDILKEEVDRQAENADEQFDLDFTLMSGELALLLGDLVAALGGEVN